jgi:hypothetical protein
MNEALKIALLPAMLMYGMLGFAQQPISGNYPGGAFTGQKGAVTFGKGSLVLENGTLHYNTRDFVNSNGESMQTSTSNIFANRTIVGYVPKFSFLGASYMAAIIIPFTNAPLRPVPNSELAFQFGDMVLQPILLGWNKGTMHYQFAYNIWLPTGRFNAGATNNTGKGLYSHMLSGGLTWMQSIENPWAATFMVRYEFVGKQRDTNIEPGNVFILEGGAGKELAKGFDLGLTYYFMTQTTEEKGSAAGTDTSPYKAAAVGPEINWRPNVLPGLQVSLRSYFEFRASNTSQGIFSVLSFAYVWSLEK